MRARDDHRLEGVSTFLLLVSYIWGTHSLGMTMLVRGKSAFTPTPSSLSLSLVAEPSLAAGFPWFRESEENNQEILGGQLSGMNMISDTDIQDAYEHDSDD